jgi:hypothetical protein
MDANAAVATDRLGPAPLGTDAPVAGRLERFFERATVAMLALFVVSAPHSIAATQTAFVLGLLLWAARMIAGRRLVVARTALDIPLGLFVGWTIVSVATSLDPAWSLGRRRGVALCLVLYLFASNVPSRRAAWLLTLALGLSVVGNLGLTYWQRIEGRGLEITSMAARSPLAQWELQPGDTILDVDGRPVRSIDELNAAFEGDRGRDAAAVRFTRGEYELVTEKRRGRVWRDATTRGPERLGVEVEPGRSFRSRAFFSHAATYAETLQLIGSVLVAWVLVAASRGAWRWAAGLGTLALLVAGALVQTQTRAPIVAFAIATVAMAVLRGMNRRAALIAAVVAAVVLAAGAAAIVRGRAIDPKSLVDDSAAWRFTVWREALPLIGEHPFVGIGPDAAKPQWKDLRLGGDGRLAPGHFHSTPLQLAVDRGLPALGAWIALMATFLVTGARLVRRLGRREGGGEDWRVTAAALGAWGAVVGFTASSLVHFNWGDSEPMEMAWCLMGISYAIARLERSGGGDA